MIVERRAAKTDSDRRFGYTLIELMLVIGLVSTIFSSLIYAQIMLTERVSYAQENVATLSESVAALGRIEQSIRDSVEIQKAGPGSLVLRSRYTIDTDDELETIQYFLSGGSLYRAVAHGTGSFGAGELMLENVTHFETRALEIKDPFDSADYVGIDSDVRGTPEDVDTLAKVEYLVRDLGKVDADLVAQYDEIAEKLAIQSVGEARTVTVSPVLDRKGLSVQTDFHPVDNAAEYRPIIYGAEDSRSVGIAVVFSDDQTIRLQISKASTVVDDQASGMVWEAGRDYRIWLEMIEDTAVVYAQEITDAPRPQMVGKADAAAIDKVRVHFQTTTPGMTGRWDNLELAYPLVDVELGVTTSGGVEMLYGGAKQRIP
ncbi:MAG: hypothetical protein AAF488_08290 [Planctomycetota bacterium]